MDLAPACIPHLLLKLTALGMRLENLKGSMKDGAGQVPASLQQAAVDRRTADYDTTGTPTKYSNIESISGSFMSENLLEPLEPGVLSTPNLRRMLTRGRAEVNKGVLQRILELGAGISTDTRSRRPLARRLGVAGLLQEKVPWPGAGAAGTCACPTVGPIWTV